MVTETDRTDEEDSKFMPNLVQYQFVQTTDKELLQQCKTLPTPNHGTFTVQAAFKRGIFHQILATCAVFVVSAAFGMPIGYSASLLSQLTATNATGEIVIDNEIGSWIASVHILAQPFGSFASGPLTDYIGRRSTILASCLTVIIGWIVLALSQSYTMLIAGRLVCGFGNALSTGPSMVYIAEIAEPKLRSLLISATFVFYSIGILIVYALGSALHWRTVAWCCNILPIIGAIALLYVPESPVWLVRQNQLTKALRALTFLRGSETEAQNEINEMQKRLQQENAMTQKNENILKLCSRRAALKPLVIVILLSVLQMFSGTTIVVFYAIDIISEFGAEVDPKTSAIFTAVVRIIFTVILCIVLLFVRRRRIVFVSSIGSGLSCLALSAYLYARVNQPKNDEDLIVAAVCVLVYIAFNTALLIMPGIMIGELLPAKIRGRTSGGVNTAMNLSLFGLIKAFPSIQGAISLRGVFMLFAVSSFLTAISMFLLQPETKGRTLDQIEDYFNEDHWFWFKRNKNYKLKEKEIESDLKD